VNKTEAIPRAVNIESTITGDIFNHRGKFYKKLNGNRNFAAGRNFVFQGRRISQQFKRQFCVLKL
jgi:hypothetical protein